MKQYQITKGFTLPVRLPSGVEQNALNTVHDYFEFNRRLTEEEVTQMREKYIYTDFDAEVMSNFLVINTPELTKVEKEVEVEEKKTDSKQTKSK